MTTLKEHQFEIVTDAEAMDGFVFGTGADVSVDEDGFDPGEHSWFTQDGENTRRGVRAFGRDVQAPKVWSWATHTDQDGVKTAVATLESFTGLWTPDAARTPGWVTAVRYRLAGRDRRVFGRPRRFVAPPTNMILNGYVPIDHDFVLMDANTYADLESTAEIPYSSSAEGGGFTFPVTFPIQTQVAEGAGEQQIVVGGTARTYPRVRLNGPWINPVVRTDDWTLTWLGSIPASGWVEIDCRPWVLTVLDHNGASAVGGLDRRVWLEDCYFEPNSKPLINLGGISSSGSATASLAWRDAFKSI